MKVKITALGNSRAGKTHLMLAMYNRLANLGEKGVSIKAVKLVRLHEGEVTEFVGQDADALLRSDFKPTLTNGTWHPGTVNRTFLEFQLLLNHQPMIDFTWVDFRGGALEGTTIDNKDTAQLLRDINESSAIVIVADSYKIFREDPTISAETTASARIQSILLDFISSHPKKPLAIPIVLSKYDVVDSLATEDQKREFNERCYTLFGNIVDLVENPRQDYQEFRGTFIPVSIPRKNGAEYKESVSGSNRFIKTLDTEMVEPPKPINVHLPLLYALARELQFERQRLLEEKKALKRYWEVKRAEKKIRDNGWDKFWGVYEIANAAERAALDIFMNHSDKLDDLENNLGFLLRIAEGIPEFNKELKSITSY